MSFDSKTRSALIRAALFVGLLAAFIYVNWPFLIPLIIAGIFALGLQDFVLKVSKRTNIRRRAWAIMTLLACIAPGSEALLKWP